MTRCHAYPVSPDEYVFELHEVRPRPRIRKRSNTASGYLSAFRRETGIVFSSRWALRAHRTTITIFPHTTKRGCAKTLPTTTKTAHPHGRFPCARTKWTVARIHTMEGVDFDLNTALRSLSWWVSRTRRRNKQPLEYFTASNLSTARYSSVKLISSLPPRLHSRPSTLLASLARCLTLTSTNTAVLFPYSIEWHIS